jgi:hypothetical protein
MAVVATPNTSASITEWPTRNTVARPTHITLETTVSSISTSLFWKGENLLTAAPLNNYTSIIPSVGRTRITHMN